MHLLNRPSNKSFILFFLAVFFSVSSAFAQLNPKLNIGLQMELRNIKAANENPYLHFMVIGDLDGIERATETLGGTYKFGLDRIASVSMNALSIEALSQSDAVERIEYYKLTYQLLDDDSMRINNRIDSVHTGYSPLPQPYLGTDVVVGVIDAGIDFRHPDFKNTDGTSRIKYIWDQNGPAPSNVANFNYGYEWSDFDINVELCTHNPNISFGHGTLTAGVAAGNGNAVGKYAGGAPDADIIMVSLESGSNNFVGNFIDGMSYIFTKAAQMGKPAVINSSVGSYWGPHDGRGSYNQSISNMLTFQPGRVLVQAGGNAGRQNYHLGYDVNSNTQFTWFEKNGGLNGIYIDLFADYNDFNNVNFALAARDKTDYTYKGNTPFFNVLTDFNMGSQTQAYYEDSLIYNGENIGNYQILIEKVQNVYEMVLYVEGTDNNDYWELQTNGSGTFDVFASKNLIGSSNMVKSNLPSTSQLPAMVDYVEPDTLKTLISLWGCNDDVIVVANYSNLSDYVDYDGITRTVEDPQGALLRQSSKGPTRDGRTKPDIGATGHIIFAPNVLEIIEWQKINEPHKVAPEGEHTRHAGTSAAAPVVTGAIALFLEMRPDVFAYEIQDYLESTALVDANVLDYDNFTPNDGFGFGKLNGYQFLLAGLTYGCDDTEAANYDPTALIVDNNLCQYLGCIDSEAVNFDAMATNDDGTCIYAGCTYPEAVNYNSNASIDDGSCIFTATSTQFPDLESVSLSNQPNPFTENTLINYQLNGNVDKIQLIITNTIGQEIRRINLETSYGSFLFNRGDIPAGVYFYSLQADGEILKTNKMILY